MNRIANPLVFNYRGHLDILKRLLISANVLAVILYTLLRIIFYDLPFVMQDEMMHVLDAAITASVAAVAVSFVIFAVDGIGFLVRKRKYGVGQLSVPKEPYRIAMGPVRSTQNGQPYFELQSNEQIVA